MGKVRFNISEQVVSSWPRRLKMSLLQKLKTSSHFKYMSSIWLIIEA